MNKSAHYQQQLNELASWDDFLLAHSGLPGPRANLELVQAVAAVGERDLFLRYLAYDAARAPTNSREEFLTLCATVGLGRLLREGDKSMLPLLRSAAADPRWRVREGVALALQLVGEHDMGCVATIAESWSQGTHFEQRAAVAALCEPKLLATPALVRRLLALLDKVTAAIPGVVNRKSDGFQALRKALGYGWSVAVAALPAEGKPALARWLGHPDRDIRWIIGENLKKQRLVRMDRAWVTTALEKNRP
jgi:hypothetical protein